MKQKQIFYYWICTLILSGCLISCSKDNVPDENENKGESVENKAPYKPTIEVHEMTFI